MRCYFANGFPVSGTLRSNLDPFGQYDDARLWDALKRAYLVDTSEKQLSSPQKNKGDTPVVGSRFGLDTVIDNEGSSLSVGQVNLARVSSPFLVVDCCLAITGIFGTSSSP